MNDLKNFEFFQDHENTAGGLDLALRSIEMLIIKKIN